jgi:hypothetical protein
MPDSWNILTVIDLIAAVIKAHLVYRRHRAGVFKLLRQELVMYFHVSLKFCKETRSATRTLEPSGNTALYTPPLCIAVLPSGLSVLLNLVGSKTM